MYVICDTYQWPWLTYGSQRWNETAFIESGCCCLHCVNHFCVVDNNNIWWTFLIVTHTDTVVTSMIDMFSRLWTDIWWVTSYLGNCNVLHINALQWGESLRFSPVDRSQSLFNFVPQEKILTVKLAILVVGWRWRWRWRWRWYNDKHVCPLIRPR